MTKVISKKTVDFPSFRWGIAAGNTRELPEDKEAREAILAHPAISEVKTKSQERREATQTNKKEVETKTRRTRK